VHGYVTDDDSYSFSVYAAFDRNYADIRCLAEELSVGSSFDASTSLSNFGGLTMGSHLLEIFAIDDTGSFSAPASLLIPVNDYYPARSSVYEQFFYPTAWPPATYDTRMPIWQIGAIAGGSLIVAVFVGARLIFGYCRYMRPKRREGGTDGDGAPGEATSDASGYRSEPGAVQV
jgi:hypothetical protein